MLNFAKAICLRRLDFGNRGKNPKPCGRYSCFLMQADLLRDGFWEGDDKLDMEGAESEQGVVLYYKFVTIAQEDVDGVAAWFSQLCSSLSLLGRVRVALNGINVTLGGHLESLRKHIVAVDAHPLFYGIDFKLSSCTQPIHPQVAAECGFTMLSVRVVKELITLGLHPSVEVPSFTNAGQHATAEEFHSLLQEASARERSSTSEEGETGAKSGAMKKCVLIDARNIYETRIGKFHPPSEVECYDPLVRQYSDLPAWLDAHQEQLRNKRVLMYCTGGVRCELASAYLRSKGEDFKEVIQLSGGIHRYLEAFEDGGFFKGKNFVFDHRMAVGSKDPEIVGHCLLCNAPFDDYSSRSRCSLCRMLVLICDTCQAAGGVTSSPMKYVCELCSRNGKIQDESEQEKKFERNSDGLPRLEVPEIGTEMQSLSGEQIAKQKLRILCLHGFRQNASSFKGRLSSLKKKLRQICEFVFVDAPHALSFVIQEHSEQPSLIKKPLITPQHEPNSITTLNTVKSWGTTSKYAWIISPTDECGQQPGESHSSPVSSTSLNPALAPSTEKNDIVIWRQAEAPFDPLQYQGQTEGWDTSWDYLQNVFKTLGPFDGVLGFSQGAAVAAALCPFRHLSPTNGIVNFKFVVLCSGFPSPVPLHKEVMVGDSGIDCPSLHIFGGQDHQIDVDKSEQLVKLFRRDKCTVVKHSFGHIIPTKPEFVQQYVNFFSKFLD